MKNLEKLPQMVKEGKISLDQAAISIMETVYKNRAWFGIKKIKDDRLHDFMLFYYERSKQIFSLYNKDLGTFASFLYGNLNNALMTWTKQTQRKSYEEMSFTGLQDIVYEESISKYEHNEAPEVLDISAEEIPSIKKILAFSQRQNQSYSFKRGRQIRQSDINKYRTEELRKEACLVLLLKSCTAVTDTLIEKTAALCGKSFKDLKSLVEKAQESIKTKTQRLIKLEKARDNFFYFKRKYNAEMESSDANTVFCELISQKIIKADLAWKDKNQQLKDENLRTPSNVTIGRLLGMSDRHVRYVINQALKNMDNISLKSYYESYENIFGKRKSK